LCIGNANCSNICSDVRAIGKMMPLLPITPSMLNHHFNDNASPWNHPSMLEITL
jgi:hypothetical protein